MGRWITADPIGFADGPNVYAYVHNNPLCYIDLDGQFAMLLIPLFTGTFGIGGITISAVTATQVAAAVGTGILSYAVYNAPRWYGNNYCNDRLDSYETRVNDILNTPDYLLPPSSILEKRGKKKDENVDEKPRDRHDPNQEALSDLAKDSKKKGVSNAEADTLIEWGKEYNFPNTRDDRGKPTHWELGEHIHLGPYHIPTGK